MKKEKIKKIPKKALALITLITVMALMLQVPTITFAESETADCFINLTDLTYTIDGTENEIPNYTQDNFDTFVSDYNSNSLPSIYTTEFLFDGVGMVKTPDLDDFIEASSNNAKIKTLGIKAINVNMIGNIEFTGTITGGMIAVNTNGITGDINLILNGVNIDTDSKKAPAIYVYNKDINYTEYKVTIKTASGTQNYIEGGKFKKVSLVGSDELSNYSSKYSGDALTNYNTYTNYYGIYESSDIDNILFAKVQADSDDLKDGDPYYFYKGAGAISSDIDLYFEGTGYLSVTSKNKEGIETKGNLTFQGGTGDYYIFAEDDCLNTTTSGGMKGGPGGQMGEQPGEKPEGENGIQPTDINFQANTQITNNTENTVRNNLTIDVNSLVAIVDPESDEGDAIDSNGTLTINGGTIYAFAHPTTGDCGLDSETGTFINGGTIIATGNMSDEVSNSSSQDFIVLNFSSKQSANSLITITDTSNTPIMAFKPNRTYTNLIYSSPTLKDETTYYVYKDGTITGTVNDYGLYTNINSYTVGTQQQWSGNGQMGAPGGQMDGPRGQKDGPNGGQTGENAEQPNGERPVKNDQQFGEDRPTPPDGQQPTDGNRPTPPDGQQPTNGNNSNSQISTEGHIEFTLSDSTHIFNNVTNYISTQPTSKMLKETIAIVNNQNTAILPCILQSENDILKISDIKSYYTNNLEIVINGTLIQNLENSNPLKTGDVISIDNTARTILIYGDSNKDGQIDIFDITQIVNSIVNEKSLTSFEFLAADVDGNEEIDIFDVTRIVNAIVTENYQSIKK